ncbi:class C sortase [Corynebacterium diphtheriae]|nr:class C sortase [Corynebacterium diphtheriae]
MIIYPVVSTQWNSWQQNRAAAEYAKLQTSIPAEVSDKEREDAHRYNEERADGPILDPWIDRFVPDNQAYQDYLAVLNSTDAMGRLIIPSVKTDLPIYHGTQEDTLQRGVGHLFGSDLPVGGEGTHFVLTGHTGLPNATLFDNLNDVKENDFFFIQVAGHKLKYQVDQIRVVLPYEVGSLRAEPGKDLVTLVTCTPYGINTHRLLVRGHQVPITEEEKTMLDETQGVVWQWWMYALSVVFIIGLIVLGWWLARQARRVKNQQLNPEIRHNNEGEL